MARDGAGGVARLAGGQENAGAQFVGDLIDNFERNTGTALTQAQRNDVFDSVANAEDNSTAAIQASIRRIAG